MTLAQNLQRALMGGRTDEIQTALESLYVGSQEQSFNVRDFKAKGDASTDDTAAIQAAINAIPDNTSGTVFLPRGVYPFTSLTIGKRGVQFVGAGQKGTELVCVGSAPTAISVTSDMRVGLERFRLRKDPSSTTLHGISFNFNGSHTGFRYSTKHVEIHDFALGNGLQPLNCEHSNFEDVEILRCAGGFYSSNPSHTGINNNFTRCRAQENGFGWDLNHQQETSFDNCQSLSNGTGLSTDIQFRLRGSSRGCWIRGLDVENPDHGVAGIGAQISGIGHKTSIYGFSLNVGLQLITATRGIIFGGDFSSTNNPFVIDATSTGNVVMPNGFAVTNNAPDTIILGANGLVTAGNGAWNGGHLVMGTRHLWFDTTGNLRTKTGAPTSDTDGVVVGTQT